MSTPDTLKRALQTAEKLAASLKQKITQDDRLREFFGGDWDGKKFTEIREKYAHDYELWKTDLSKVRVNGAETAEQVQKRALEALTEIAENNKGKTVAVISHRVTIRTLLCVFEKKPLEEINTCMWLSNCSVSALNYDGKEFIPVKMGQDAFLGDRSTPVKSLM